MIRRGRGRALPEVLVSQNTWAHYRQELADQLQHSPELLITFIHDPAGPITKGTDPIRPIDGSALEREISAPITEFGPVLWQPGLVHAFRTGRYDAVILQGDPRNLSNWVILVWSRYGRLRTPVLLWTHGWSRTDRRMTALTKRLFFGLASAVLVYSQRAVQIGIAAGHSPDRLFFIGNSIPAPPRRAAVAAGEVDKDRDRQTRPSRMSSDGRVNIVTVVRLTRDRELHELLEAMALLQTQHMPSRLDLVGEGRDLERLRTLADGSGLDVVFHGAIDEPASLAALYACADVSVIPGRAGLAVAQALFHGVPVIAHNDFGAQMPEAAAIQTGVSGEFYERHNVVDLAKQIRRVVEGRRSGGYSAEDCVAVADDSFSTSKHANRMVAAIVATLQATSSRTECPRR